MSAFGTLAGAAVAGGESSSPARDSAAGADTSGAESRSMFASMFSSLLAPSAASGQPWTRASSAKDAAAARPKAAPSWMAKTEAMDDEAGVTCAVCQDGRTLQPSELLGLYAFMKVTIPSSQGGGKGDIDRTVLLLSLPTSCPGLSQGYND